MAEDEGTISVEVRNHILLMGFNRPEKYNGYTPRMAKELLAAITRLDEEDNLRCGVIFGHGDHFTAGLDQLDDLLNAAGHVRRRDLRHRLDDYRGP